MTELMIEQAAEVAMLLMASLNVLASALLAFLADLPRVNGGKRMMRVLFWSHTVAWMLMAVVAVRAMYTPASDGWLLGLGTLAGAVSLAAKVRILWWLRY